MSTILIKHIKLCKCVSTYGNLTNTTNLILKKYVRIPSVANYVKKTTKQETTIDLTHSDITTGKQNLVPQWYTPTITDVKNLLQYYLKLSKYRLTSLVVITSMAGYAMAPAPFDLTSFTCCAIGTGLLSAAANAVNQFHEVPFDAKMKRTQYRVLVCGQLTPLHSLGFASVASLTGLASLYFGVNGVTTLLGFGNLLLYTSVYTPLKRVSIANTWVGSVVGAIPPLMGWAACSDTFGPGAWLMAALLYSWQFPHFNALSWNMRPDYLKAGYKMMAVSNPDLCRRVSLRHTIALQFMCMAAPYLDVTNWWFLLECTPINLYFIYLAYQFYSDSSSQTSRKLFRFSLLHLPLVMILFLVNKKKMYILNHKCSDNSVINENNLIM